MARRVASTRDLRLQHGLSFKYLKQKWLLVKTRPATLLSSRSVGPEWNMSLVDRLRLAIGYWNLLIGFALAADRGCDPPTGGVGAVENSTLVPQVTWWTTCGAPQSRSRLFVD